SRSERSRCTWRRRRRLGCQPARPRLRDPRRPSSRGRVRPRGRAKPPSTRPSSASPRPDAMYDVSFVTDALRDIITAAIAPGPVFGGGPPPFTLGVSSQHPQDAAASPNGDCDLNLYLFHMVEDRYVRNQFWTQQSITGQPPGPARQPVAFEPLCL